MLKEYLKDIQILWSPVEYDTYKIVFPIGLTLEPGDALVLVQNSSNSPFTIQIERNNNAKERNDISR